jgi:hypothetical protein
VAGFCEHGNEPSGSINWRERGIYFLVAELGASQDRIYSIQLFVCSIKGPHVELKTDRNKEYI